MDHTLNSRPKIKDLWILHNKIKKGGILKKIYILDILLKHTTHLKYISKLKSYNNKE